MFYISKKIIILFFLMGCINKKLPPIAENISSEKCQFKFEKIGQCAEIDWIIKPTEEEFGEFKIVVSPPYEGDLKVFLWMPSMGHGSSPVNVSKLDEETFLVSEVFFSMPGNWDIHIQQIKNNNVIDQTIIPYIF